MRISKNFHLQELVHPKLYSVLGERVQDWLNPMLPFCCQALRDEFGPMIVNDWWWELDKEDWESPMAWITCYTDSGLRLPQGDVGAIYSSHRGGCAVDLKFLQGAPAAAQKQILEDPESYPYITRMENVEITKVWLHVEVGKRRPGDNIIVFNP